MIVAYRDASLLAIHAGARLQVEVELTPSLMAICSVRSGSCTFLIGYKDPRWRSRTAIEGAGIKLSDRFCVSMINLELSDLSFEYNFDPSLLLDQDSVSAFNHTRP